MTDDTNGQNADRRPQKRLWFGYGNYGGLPNLQVGGGMIRDPSLFKMLSGGARTERSSIRFVTCAAAALVGVMLLVMLMAWGVTFFLG